MIHRAHVITARLLTQLPEKFHYSGEQTAWVKMTRPGQSLHSFLEGIQIDRYGSIWICDVPYGRIFEITPTLDWNLYYCYDGEPHSIKTTAQDDHIVVDYQLGLLKFNAITKQMEVLACAKRFGFKGLSDLSIATDHTIWFTDSGRTSLIDPTGVLYSYHAEHGIVQRADNIPYPNGIALSPCNNNVYVSATQANAILRFKAGLGSHQQPMLGVFVHLSGGLGPDGLAVNKDGDLAIAQAQAGRAYILNSVGDLIAEVRTPYGQWTTSVTFAREDDKTLYLVDAQTGSIFQASLEEIIKS